MTCPCCSPFFFFFTDTATTEIYTLSLHDALPICTAMLAAKALALLIYVVALELVAVPAFALLLLEPSIGHAQQQRDRKSTRLNSSHGSISYAVFCLKKKTYQRRYQTGA